MSTLEYGTYTGPPLQGDRLHRCLIDLQDSTIRKQHLKRPSLSLSEYEDLYARAVLVLLEKHPDATFPAPQAVVSWLDTTISHSAIDILRRRNLGRETNDIVSVTDARGGEEEPSVLQPVDAAPTPEQHALLNEDNLTLTEFIASLDPEDRKISLLHLHPGSRMKLKQIARALDLPVPQVNAVLKRVDKRFSRYIALEVDAVCALRQRDLAAWKRTGEMSAALRWHARRCSTCNAQIAAARSDVYRSLIPLGGAIALSAGGVGYFSRLYHFLGSRPLVIRANEALSRIRRAGPLGAGGSGAILTAKTIVATAVVGTVAAAGAGVAAIQSKSNTPSTHRTTVTGTIATHTTAPPRTTSTHVVTATPPVTSTKPKTKPKTVPKTTTTAKLTTTPQLTPSRATSPSPIVPSPVPAQTTQTTPTTTRTAIKRPSESKPAASPKPTGSTPKAAATTSTTTTTKSSTTRSGSSGGLPDVQQTEQQP
jgi:RNA polymerase sigma factor (sigma-70 family)